MLDKREQLKELRKKHMRERAEIRDDEMYAREGEDMRIEQLRESMAGVLADPNLSSEDRKSKLAVHKATIDDILERRDDREHDFIEQELKHHQLEQELEQQIEAEELKKNPPPETTDDSLKLQLRARPFLAAGAEQMRKIIEENRKALNEDEQFSTILVNNSERENIPSFVRSRRKKEEKTAPPRIDTIVIKQREIGMMYRESQELQESQLNKKKPEAPPPEIEEEHDIEEEE